MPEIGIKGAGEEAAKKSAKSGGSPFDLMGMLDQLEEAQERLMDNPQLAQMLGVDLSDFTESMEQAQEDGKDHGIPLNAETLLAMLQGVEQQGFADKTVSEIREWVENNPTMVDRIIEKQGQQADGGD